ncbi:MAG: hypothetical protein DME03_16735, partial [Candidatus Rokuibacteriota bacterium]
AAERDPALEGYLWQGKQYEGLVVNVLEAFWANGTRLLGEDGTILPEPARAADALRFLRGLIETNVSPAWTTAADEELTRRAFGDGHAIFLRNWPYAMELFEAPGSAVRGKVAFTSLPGRARGAAGVGSTGGAHLAVSRRSRHPELAVALARHLTSQPAQRAIALGAALSPTRRDLYHDPELVRAHPGMPRLDGLMLMGQPRPVTPAYLLVSSTVQPEFSAALVGVKSPERAIADRGARLGRARQGGVHVASRPRPRRGGRGLDGRRASGGVAPEPPSRAGGGPGASPHEPAGPAGDRARRRAEPHAPRSLPRSRARARAPRNAAPRRAHADGPAAPGDARVPSRLVDGAARVLGGARRGEVAGAGDRRRARPARLFPRGHPMTRREAVNRRRGVLLLAPTVLALGTLTVYPGVWVLWLSLQHRIPIFGVSRFAGLDNYAFLAIDSRFASAAATTIIFTVTSVALEVVLGVAAALAIHAQRGGRRVALSLLLLAWAMPAVVTAKLFEWLYHPTAGLLNVALGGHALNWLGDPHLALPAVVLADVWRTMPFVAVLCYARLLAIPAELYEAAQVDGAGRLATLVLITLPMLARILLVAILFRTLDALRAFDLMFVLTGGGPAGTTETITVYAYRALFQTLQLGFGSALGVVVFVLVMAVAWAYLKILRTSAVTA